MKAKEGLRLLKITRPTLSTYIIGHKKENGQYDYDNSSIYKFLNKGNTRNTEKEFLEEIVSLIHSFGMKMYSSRRKRN